MSGNCSSAHADDDVARAKVRAPDERFARTRSTPPTDRSPRPRTRATPRGGALALDRWLARAPIDHTIGGLSTGHDSSILH